MSQRAESQDASDWLSQRERGTVLVIRLTAWLATTFGRRPSRVLVWFIAAYYALFDRSVRRASRNWLARVHGSPKTSWAQTYSHVRCFAQVTVDRLFFAQGRIDAFEIDRTGNQHLIDLQNSGKGAILLGAHLGSFEAMRAGAQLDQFPITIVGHFENAAMITYLLQQLDPDFDGRVLHVGQNPVSLALNLRDRLEQGESVAILADRVGLNDKYVEVDFFGSPARFATGPFLLAAILQSPIYLVFGLYREPNRYELLCEPFAERVDLPRKRREEALQEVVSRYARRLEHYCRLAPDNWFNFFEFWEREK